MRKLYILLVLALFFAGYGLSVQRMEAVLAEGKTVLLPLAPVDPRALLMGDYMALRYEANNDILGVLYAQNEGLRRYNRNSYDGRNIEGLAVLRVTNAPVPMAVEFVRLDDGSPLKTNEFLLHYRLRGHEVRTVASAYYFEEGTAQAYTHARFGQFKLAANGKTLLIGLCDAKGMLIAGTKREK